MRERPHDPRAPLVNAAMFERITVTALGLALGALFVFMIGQRSNRSVETVSAMTLTAIALGQWVTALNSRSTVRSIFSRMRKNPALRLAFVTVILMQVGILYIPFLARIFSVAPLSMSDWAIVVLGSVPVVVVDEVRKVWYRQRYRPTLTPV